jgi:SAM-dependent methyltransferase
VIDQKDFWNKKILGWEAGRYQASPKSRWSLIERIADQSSSSLRYRQEMAVSLIKDFVPGRAVVELGCGSGLLAERYIDAGAKSYLGIDIADRAIEEALQRKEKAGWGEIVTFSSSSIVDMPVIDDDAIVVSLGLLDWLTDQELEILIERQGQADFLHAISECRNTISQLLHRSYVHLAYGFRTGNYVPRYMVAKKIAADFMKHNDHSVRIYRHRKLSFGALLSSFPVGPEIDG